MMIIHNVGKRCNALQKRTMKGHKLNAQRKGTNSHFMLPIAIQRSFNSIQ